MDLIVVLKGALPPILAALLFVSAGGVRLLSLAMAVGLFIAYALLRRELPDTPFTLWNEPDGRQWLLWVVVAAAVVCTLEHLGRLSTKVGAALGAGTAAFGVYLMLAKQAPRWSFEQVLTYIGAGALAAAVLVMVCRRVITRAPSGIASSVVFVMLLSLDAVLLTLGESALLGQLCGAVAAAAGAGAATVLWRRGFSLAVADGTWLGAAHALFALSGMHLAGVPLEAMVCALFAPCALLLVPAKETRAVRWATLSLLAIAGPMAAALWLTHSALA